MRHYSYVLFQTYSPPCPCTSPPGRRWTGIACWPPAWPGLWVAGGAALWSCRHWDGAPRWSPVGRTASLWSCGQSPASWTWSSPWGNGGKRGEGETSLLAQNTEPGKKCQIKCGRGEGKQERKKKMAKEKERKKEKREGKEGSRWLRVKPADHLVLWSFLSLWLTWPLLPYTGIYCTHVYAILCICSNVVISAGCLGSGGIHLQQV